MARRASNAELPPQPPKKPSRVLGSLRVGAQAAMVASALVGCLWAAVKVEQFVVTDPQFVLEGPPEPGSHGGSFSVAGIERTPEQRVLAVFARDFGRSVYLCPIKERRRRLLAIDWVRDASVSRVWPNRILIRIEERVPVAFVQVPARDGATASSLIDGEGYLLDPRNAGQLALPVLTGFPVGEPLSGRLQRVKSFLRLSSELGSLMDGISEIDIADTDNLKLTQEFDGRALTLMVGDRNFLTRYRNLLSNRAEILKRLPDASVLDLRLKDRITAVARTVGGVGGTRK